jgi:hypothetical protein
MRLPMNVRRLPMLLGAVALIGGCSSGMVPGSPVPVNSGESDSADDVRVFDATYLEDGVRIILTEDYNVAGVDDVRCPPDEEVRVGHRFTCTVTIEGNQRSVIITVRTEEGEYEVSPPQ